MATWSPLTNVIVPAHSSNFTARRNQPIRKITVHHVAGRLSAEAIGRIFQAPNRNASANYNIGFDGRISGSVPEEGRAWSSAHPNNDNQAINIEVSNSENRHPWGIPNEAWQSLIRLCVDICRRHNFRLTYDGTPNGSLTRHNMFRNTTCPGPTLQARFPELVRLVNAQLDGTNPPKPTGQRLHLPKTATSWRVYPLNVAPVVGNEIGFLRPNRFGGLTYDILARPMANVVTIQTRDFGRVNIFVAPSTGAVIK